MEHGNLVSNEFVRVKGALSVTGLELFSGHNYTEILLSKTSIYCLQEEQSIAHFWFCLKDGHDNFEKLRLKFSKCDSSPSLPSAQQRAVNNLSVVIWSSASKPPLFLSFH